MEARYLPWKPLRRKEVDLWTFPDFNVTDSVCLFGNFEDFLCFYNFCDFDDCCGGGLVVGLIIVPFLSLFFI